jgi:heptose-I-phosphate ethanolaminephosphotransferase
MTSKELTASDIQLAMRQAILFTVCSYILQYISHTPLFSKCWMIPIVIGMIVSSTEPVLRCAVNYDDIARFSSKGDVFFGAYTLLFLMSAQYIASQKYKWKFLQAILAIITVSFIIIPIIQLVYWGIYNVCISESAMYAIQQTNSREAYEFVVTYLGMSKGAGIFIVCMIACFCIYKYNTKAAPTVYNSESNANKGSIIVILIFIILAVSLPMKFLPATNFYNSWMKVSHYRNEELLFNENHQQNLDSLQLDQINTLAQREPGTVIVVIGESESRNYMKTYQDDFPYDDTPWLETCRHNDNFIVYDNVYSCYNHTAQVLLRALTEKSQYNDKRFNTCVSVIDIARKAGYDTYWYTNQYGMGKDDTPTTLIAKTADKWGGAQAKDKDRLTYDDDLLPLLQTIPANKNNFIVLHIMGSHALYQSRYPQDREKWTEGTRKARYANTVLYTDDFLRQVYEYASQNMHLQAMIYFSDHGENVNHGHNPQIKTFDNVRIPMFIYVSPQYQTAFPQKAVALRMHQKEYFTNDMVYNTVSGLLGAESNKYDEKEDFSSFQYGYTRDSIWTFLKTVRVTADDSEPSQ